MKRTPTAGRNRVCPAVRRNTPNGTGIRTSLACTRHGRRSGGNLNMRLVRTPCSPLISASRSARTEEVPWCFGPGRASERHSDVAFASPIPRTCRNSFACFVLGATGYACLKRSRWPVDKFSAPLLTACMRSIAARSSPPPACAYRCVMRVVPCPSRSLMVASWTPAARARVPNL